MERFPIFISYSRRDIEQIRRIRDEVESATGARCWMDLRAIESGAKRFTKDIIDGINNCDVLLFMLTEHSQCSEFALRELDFADKKGKHVVIINVNDCAMTDEFQFLYGLTDTISWTDVPQREKLLRDLKRWIAEAEPQPDLEQERLEQERLEREKLERERTERERQESERKAREAAEKERLTREAAEKEKQERERIARERQDVVANPKPNKKSLPWIICGVAAVAVLLVLLLVPKNNHQPKDNPTTPVVGNTIQMSDLTFTVNGVSFTMKPVEGGTFQMGSDDGEANDDEQPTHTVSLNDYYIGEFEVTQGLWYAVMGASVSQQRDKVGVTEQLKGEGDDYPMYYVNWNECQEFVKKLKRIIGLSFRLPTEAEWEYAARGGNKSNGNKYSGSNSIEDVAWCASTTNDSGTSPVGMKSPNELGIYDMSGNVWEWCQDWYGSYNDFSQTNPIGPSDGFSRVRRGGGWYSLDGFCRVSMRYYRNPGDRSVHLGFRLALSR